MLNFDNDLNAISDALIESKKAYYYDTGGGYTFLENSKQEVFVPYGEFDRFNEAICTMKFPDNLYHINFTKSEGYFAVGYDIANECYSGYLEEISDELKSILKNTLKKFDKCVSDYKRVKEILLDREFYEKQYKYQFESYNLFLTEYRLKTFELEEDILMYRSEIESYLEKLNNVEDSSKGILVFERIV